MSDPRIPVSERIGLPVFPKPDGRGRRLPAFFCLLFSLAAAGVEISPAPPDAADQAAALRQALQAEEEQLVQVRNAHQEALAVSARQRRSLAEQLLAARTETRRLEDANAALATAAAELAADTAEARNSWQRVAAAAAGLAEAFAVHQAEVPGEIHSLPAPAGEPQAETLSAAGLAALFGQVEQTLQAAGRIRVQAVVLRTASGLPEKVLLLSVGQVAAAYLVEQDPSRVGLALASPLDARGFRWTESIPEKHRGQLRGTIQSLNGGAAAADVVRVPMDVTGQMPAGREYRKTGLLQVLAKGRMAMIPLLLIAVIALGLLAERFFVLYLRNPLYSGLLEKTLGLYQAEGKAAAESLVAQRRGVLPRVLGACLAAQPHGAEGMEDGIQTQMLHELPGLRRFLSGLAILAGVAPLLGLLGTVTGIIRTFEAMQSFGNANPHLLAGGISEALITTATGLIVAIPILLLRGLLSGRSERLVAQAESQAATLLNALIREGHAKP